MVEKEQRTKNTTKKKGKSGSAKFSSKTAALKMGKVKKETQKGEVNKAKNLSDFEKRTFSHSTKNMLP